MKTTTKKEVEYALCAFAFNVAIQANIAKVKNEGKAFTPAMGRKYDLSAFCEYLMDNEWEDVPSALEKYLTYEKLHGFEIRKAQAQARREAEAKSLEVIMSQFVVTE